VQAAVEGAGDCERRRREAAARHIAAVVVGGGRRGDFAMGFSECGEAFPSIAVRAGDGAYT
jgi:hypothetical protein